MDDAGLDAALFAEDSALASVGGARRPLRVPVDDVAYSGGADEHGPYLKVSFQLGRGVYATSVLAEVMKPASDPPA